MTRFAIEERLPVGTKIHEAVVAKDRARRLEPGLERILERTPAIATRRSGTRMDRVFRSLGSMGGGNHFFELQRSTTGAVWLMLHSGSRGIGSRIGMHFIAEAKERIEREGVDLPDRNLAWLDEGSDAFERYFEAVLWAQDYARENRLAMLDLALAALRTTLGADLAPVRAAVSCHHNYVERERHAGEEIFVTRKGAIRAGKGELGIIPGSMGARSYIVRGAREPGVVRVGGARSRAADVAKRGEGDIRHRRPGAPDRRGGVPKGRRRHRRDLPPPTRTSTR